MCYDKKDGCPIICRRLRSARKWEVGTLMTPTLEVGEIGPPFAIEGATLSDSSGKGAPEGSSMG